MNLMLRGRHIFFNRFAGIETSTQHKNGNEKDLLSSVSDLSTPFVVTHPTLFVVAVVVFFHQNSIYSKMYCVSDILKKTSIAVVLP